MEIKSKVTRFAGLLCIAGALQGIPVIYSANPGGIISVARQGTYHLTGTIVDGYGEPVIRANVVEKGTTNGAVTDIDGKFSLEVAPDAVLTISFIGYISKEITLKGERAESGLGGRYADAGQSGRGRLWHTEESEPDRSCRTGDQRSV